MPRRREARAAAPVLLWRRVGLQLVHARWKTAFPNNNWKTIRTVVTHLGLRIAHHNTLIEAGGGQVGMTSKP